MSLSAFLALQRGENHSLSPPTKSHPNESTTPAFKHLPVDRASPKGGAGVFAVALGARGLGAVTPRIVVRWPYNELDISNEPDG